MRKRDRAAGNIGHIYIIVVAAPRGIVVRFVSPLPLLTHSKSRPVTRRVFSADYLLNNVAKYGSANKTGA